MGYGVGQGVRPTHPGDPLPPWGRFGRAGCFIFVAIVIAIITIAYLIGATRPPAPPPSPDPLLAGQPRVIELEATATLQFLQDGEQVRAIPVTPGETLHFRVDNTAGFDHSFYIGRDRELREPGAVTDIGIAPWPTGIRELEWVVPDDITGLRFGCTIPGHYTLMHGRITLAAD